MTRRLFKRYEVWCDGEDCAMWEIEGEAKRLGWIRRKRRHYCPECAQHLEQARGVPAQEVGSGKENEADCSIPR